MTFVHCDIKECIHSVGGLCRKRDIDIDRFTIECKSSETYDELMKQRPNQSEKVKK